MNGVFLFIQPKLKNKPPADVTDFQKKLFEQARKNLDGKYAKAHLILFISLRRNSNGR